MDEQGMPENIAIAPITLNNEKVNELLDKFRKVLSEQQSYIKEILKEIFESCESKDEERMASMIIAIILEEARQKADET